MAFDHCNTLFSHLRYLTVVLVNIFHLKCMFQVENISGFESEGYHTQAIFYYTKKGSES